MSWEAKYFQSSISSWEIILVMIILKQLSPLLFLCWMKYKPFPEAFMHGSSVFMNKDVHRRASSRHAKMKFCTFPTVCFPLKTLSPYRHSFTARLITFHPGWPQPAAALIWLYLLHSQTFTFYCCVVFSLICSFFFSWVEQKDASKTAFLHILNLSSRHHQTWTIMASVQERRFNRLI